MGSNTTDTTAYENIGNNYVIDTTFLSDAEVHMESIQRRKARKGKNREVKGRESKEGKNA